MVYTLEPGCVPGSSMMSDHCEKQTQPAKKTQKLSGSVHDTRRFEAFTPWASAGIGYICANYPIPQPLTTSSASTTDRTSASSLSSRTLTTYTNTCRNELRADAARAHLPSMHSVRINRAQWLAIWLCAPSCKRFALRSTQRHDRSVASAVSLQPPRHSDDYRARYRCAGRRPATGTDGRFLLL